MLGLVEKGMELMQVQGHVPLPAMRNAQQERVDVLWDRQSRLEQRPVLAEAGAQTRPVCLAEFNVVSWRYGMVEAESDVARISTVT